MISALITWANVPFARSVFAVYHWRKPSGTLPLKNVLVIPDKWSADFEADTFYLLTEEERVATGFAGRGISIESYPHVDDGDIVLYDCKSNRLEFIFQVKSTTNSLYVTNACNSKCQFCPQPSTCDDGKLYEVANAVMDLVERSGECVNITGGEPTINKNEFLRLLRHGGERWPDTKLFVLTNGRNFANREYVEEVFAARNGKTLGFGIPLYADSACVHDQVVGVKGAFGQTIRGLYNLASYHTEIEIRFVFSKLSYKRLPHLIEFVGRNIPFVTRIAVMGLEPMGYCRSHWNDFWIDPEDCHDVLLEANRKADNYGVDMLLYNFQLCCVPVSMRHLSCVSISEWKRTYLDECISCTLRENCGGFFASQNQPEYLPKRFSCDSMRATRLLQARHVAPMDDSPSKCLEESFSKYANLIPKGIVCDVACGYGRNGGYVMRKGWQVAFVDVDEKALQVVNEKYGSIMPAGDCDSPLATVVHRDLISEGWMDVSGDCVGIVMVHFYNLNVLRDALRSLVKGGFVYFESIDDRGNNHWELPRKSDVMDLMEGFDVKVFKERSSRKDNTKVVCTVFAIKN